MFKRILISLAFACVMVLPFSVNALSLSNYETTNFKETLDLEEIDYEFKSYKEGKNKINIYMFRGQGCYYCRNFLSFLNSRADDYGKYFNLVAFEVWNDSNNNQL